MQKRISTIISYKMPATLETFLRENRCYTAFKECMACNIIYELFKTKNDLIKTTKRREIYIESFFIFTPPEYVIWYAFNWENSEQGYEFWQKINKKWLESELSSRENEYNQYFYAIENADLLDSEDKLSDRKYRRSTEYNININERRKD